MKNPYETILISQNEKNRQIVKTELAGVSAFILGQINPVKASDYDIAYAEIWTQLVN